MQEEGKRACGDSQDREHAELPALSRLERPDREQAERDPRANGKAAEMTSPAQTTANVRSTSGQPVPTAAADDDRERERRRPIEMIASALIPKSAASG